MAKPTKPDKRTKDAEREDAHVESGPDRPPTKDEARKAEAHGELDDDVVEHEEEMAERGAHQRGEGRIP